MHDSSHIYIPPAFRNAKQRWSTKSLKLPCEIAVKSVVPSIRSCIALELVRNYGMTQEAAAEHLGITQTAISKYFHRVRGKALQRELEKESEVYARLIEIVAAIANHDLSGSDIRVRICSLCRFIRKRGIMCRLCRAADSTMRKDQCRICIENAEC